MDRKNSYLLDTHIFIWWMTDDKRLPDNLRGLIKDNKNSIYLSVVSIWEMIIKIKLKKLKLPKNWTKTLKDTKIEILPLEFGHVIKLEKLPVLHKDPFDRMLIAQALEERLVLITNDIKIKRYKVKKLF